MSNGMRDDFDARKQMFFDGKSSDVEFGEFQSKGNAFRTPLVAKLFEKSLFLVGGDGDDFFEVG